MGGRPHAVAGRQSAVISGFSRLPRDLARNHGLAIDGSGGSDKIASRLKTKGHFCSNALVSGHTQAGFMAGADRAGD